MSISFDVETTCISNKPLLQQNCFTKVPDRAHAAVEIFWNCYRRGQILCSGQKLHKKRQKYREIKQMKKKKLFELVDSIYIDGKM